MERDGHFGDRESLETLVNLGRHVKLWDQYFEKIKTVKEKPSIKEAREHFQQLVGFDLAYVPPPLDNVADDEYSEKNDENTETGKHPKSDSVELIAWVNPIEYWKDFAEGARDLRRGEQDMEDADMQKSDPYFHCRANCEASKRGPGGQDAARNLSWFREIYQTYLHFGTEKEKPEERKEDEAANAQGQRAGRDNPDVDCYEACADLIPESGIPRRHLPPDADPEHIYIPPEEEN